MGRGWVGALGAVVGLFTGCPTCAGLFFANFLGGAGAVSFATVLGYYQPAFILLSTHVLLVAPYLMSRGLSKIYAEGCVVLQAEGHVRVERHPVSPHERLEDGSEVNFLALPAGG